MLQCYDPAGKGPKGHLSGLDWIGILKYVNA